MFLIIMGAPGSGKGTCCADLKNALNIPHISTGDMFRKAIKDETPLGLKIKELISGGHFVPDEVTNELVKERIKLDDCKNGFILDGYPRNLFQAESFKQTLNELNISLDAAINFDIDNQIIINRIINRRTCEKCGFGYNLISLKPTVDGVCDKCGGKLITRPDDNEETVKTRLNVYMEQTHPLIEYYEHEGLLVTVNADGTPDDVLSRVLEALKK